MLLIWFIFGMMIETSPKFHEVPSPPQYMTLRSRSQTWILMLKFNVHVFRTSLFPNLVMDLVSFGMITLMQYYHYYRVFFIIIVCYVCSIIFVMNQQNPGRGLLQPKTGLRLPVIYYWPFQWDASFVVYSNCHCSSAFCLSLTNCSINLG